MRAAAMHIKRKFIFVCFYKVKEVFLRLKDLTD